MKAMMLLVEPLIPALRRYARSLLKDRAAADDLVQDALERVITRWHQRDPEADVRAWVFTILHNLAMSRLRQTVRRGAAIEVDRVDERLLGEPPQQETGLLRADLLAALDTLHEDQQRVLLLVSVEGLSYAEVAKVLDVPLGTVMSRLSRARARLMRLMEGETPDAGRARSLQRVK